MMISTKGRYALRILIDIAEHQADGYVPLKESAERQEISEKYLESIVNTLVRAGLVEGLRGKGGGYRLSRQPEQVNVCDVIEIMEGSLAPVSCLEEGSRPCARMSICQTLPLWQGLNDVVVSYLRQFSIQDLMRKEHDSYDYVI